MSSVPAGTFDVKNLWGQITSPFPRNVSLFAFVSKQKMRYSYLIFFLILLAFSSCKKSNISGHNHTGRWQETEFYESMGAGPAGWQPSSSHRVIEFKADGKLNGFSEVNRFKLLSDSTLEVWSTSGFFRYTWRIQELTEDKLELSYSCVEGCGGRFVAVK